MTELVTAKSMATKPEEQVTFLNGKVKHEDQGKGMLSIFNIFNNINKFFQVAATRAPLATCA